MDRGKALKAPGKRWSEKRAAERSRIKIYL